MAPCGTTEVVPFQNTPIRGEVVPFQTYIRTEVVPFQTYIRTQVVPFSKLVFVGSYSVRRMDFVRDAR
jgi:hypothetical protein